MSTRSERDRNKTIQEKYQSILSDLLKDEDNKYCVDCDAKGNLGLHYVYSLQPTGYNK